MNHLHRLLTLVFFFCSATIIASTETIHHDHQQGIFYTILDSATGKILLETGLHVESGDELITEDNKFYHVSRIIEYIAYADYLSDKTYVMEELAIPSANGSSSGKLIGIYHSHTDEAFTPTDGRSSIRGNGSIIKVGDAFAEKLRYLGYTVDHDLTQHDPHDANAYIRSRRTVAKLLGEQPAALFDIHRDSAPASAYKLTINNESLARIVIVVGRANQYMPTTLAYAKQLKSAADAQYPKLIRGIFFASGHYNQDIDPRNVLIEIGTEGSTLEESQKSAALFAGIMPAVLGGPQESTPGGGNATAIPPEEKSPAVLNTESTAWQNLLLLIGCASAGGIAYLYLSTGSWRRVRQKLAQLRNLEFINLIGLCVRKKNKDQNDSGEE
jgi:stage II sporulation protein P